MNDPNEKICFKVKIEIPEIASENNSESTEYLGEVIFETNSEFIIKIYFDDSTELDQRVMGWDPKYSYNLLSKFKVTKVISPEYLLHIDFCDYSYNLIRSRFANKESEQNYLTIKSRGIKLIYKANEQLASEIYLNETAFSLIELNYKYDQDFNWNDSPFKWQPVNNVKDYIHFNDIEFVPENNTFIINKSSDKIVNLEKEPRLRIKHVGLTEFQVKEHVIALCDLYSFYTNKKIDWQFSRIYAEGKLFVEIKDVSSEDNKYAHGLFIWEFVQNPLNLIRNVDSKHLINNRELVSRFVERFNYALKTSDETKFMILYSLLEQLRNQYIITGKIDREMAGNPPNPKKVKEEYKFIYGVDKTNSFIKEALEKISQIVDENDRNLFISEVGLKVSAIKLLSMANQFESYFSYLKMDPKEYGLNFSELKSLRDKIFHGRGIDEVDYLKKVNWGDHLPKFTGVLLLKFFGIDDLKEVNNKRLFE
jgi:hypothetical protein